MPLLVHLIPFVKSQVFLKFFFNNTTVLHRVRQDDRVATILFVFPCNGVAALCANRYVIPHWKSVNDETKTLFNFFSSFIRFCVNFRGFLMLFWIGLWLKNMFKRLLELEWLVRKKLANPF